MDGLLDAGSRMLTSRPYGEYPMDETGAEITITLLGSETGSGFIMDEKGIPWTAITTEKLAETLNTLIEL